jgi:hypothetical protein
MVPGQPGQDRLCRISKTGLLGQGNENMAANTVQDSGEKELWQDSWDRKAWAGQLGQDSWDRKSWAGQDSWRMSGWYREDRMART